MQYELMNKNQKIALLHVGKYSAYISEIYGYIPGNIGNIYEWIDSRTSPVGRENINILLKLADIRDKAEFLRVTHAICLTDTLWVRELGSSMKWEKVSPFTNNFSRIMSNIVLDGICKPGNLRSPSPDYTVDGTADKCWKRENSKIYLYKTSGERWSGITGNRPYCEYYANQVADALIEDKRHFVPYRIKVSITRQGHKKAYVYCPIFTSENRWLIPYCNSAYREYRLDELDEKVLKNDRDKLILREMLILDSLILNYDRHDANYGILADANTYKILGLAPIFDNDCSLGNFVSLQSVNNVHEAYLEALKKKPRTEMGDYIDQAKWAMTSKLKQRIRSMYPFRFKRINKRYDLEDERIQFMEYIVNSQIKAITS